MRFRHIGLILLVLLIAACSGPSAAPAVTPAATARAPTVTALPPPAASPAPAATALPPIATAPARLADYWPTDAWRSAAPEEQGVDAALLDEMFAAIDRRGIEVHAVLVVRNGYLVAERYTPPYDEGTRHELFSVTKSVVATLAGIALAEQHIAGVEAPLAELLPERDLLRSDPQKAAITLEDLLTMRAGLAWTEGNPAYASMYRSSDWVDTVLELPMAEEPGSRFNYCSGCSHLLAASVQSATGRPLLAYAEEKLFGPLGIRQVAWDTDASGMPIGGWGLQLTPRDMAKLGYLYLHNGSWDGRQVVPAEWVSESVARHTSTDSELGYGYQWWVYPRHGAYLARGRGGQLVVVVPDRALVVVFTADIPDDKVLFELIDEFIVPAAPVVS